VLEAGAIVRSSNEKGTEMIYVREALIFSHDQHDADLQSIRAFLHDHGSALVNAAYHLGGGSSSNAVFRLVDDLRAAQKLTATHLRQLARLHSLLALENVGDPSRAEAAYFASLVPGSSLVDEICLITDALDDVLIQLSSIKSDPAVLCEANFTDAA
jgi:hypothetical protein